MSTPKTTGPKGPLASGDPLARAIAGAKQLREAGFHPAVVQVGEARIELAIPVYAPSPGARAGGSGAPGPKSLAHKYLPGAAADVLTGGGGLGGGQADSAGPEVDGDFVPAVRG